MEQNSKPSRPRAPPPAPPRKSRTRDDSPSFDGLVYRCATAEKQWIAVTKTHGSISIHFDGDRVKGIVEAESSGQSPICFDLHAGMKVRGKEKFVQWGSKADAEMHGARFGSVQMAGQFTSSLTDVISKLQGNYRQDPVVEKPKSQPQKKPAPQPQPQQVNDVKIRVQLPGKQTTVVAVPQNFTMLKLLCHICEKRHLNPRVHTLSLPPDGPGKKAVEFDGSTKLSTLNFEEVHLVALPPKNATKVGNGSVDSSAGQLRLVVHLPYHGEKTVVAVSPRLTLVGLLSYLCEKRSLKEKDCSLELTSGRHKSVNMALSVGDLKASEIRLLHKRGSLKRSSCVIPPKAIDAPSKANGTPARPIPPKPQQRSYGHVPLVPHNIAPQWERLFQIGGISASQVADPKVSKALNQFVLAKGGLEAFLKDEKAVAAVCGTPGFRSILKLDSPAQRQSSASSSSTASTGSPSTPRKKKMAPPPPIARIKAADSEPSIPNLSTAAGGGKHSRASSSPSPLKIQNVKRKAPAPPVPSPHKVKPFSESDKSSLFVSSEMKLNFEERIKGSPKKIRLGPSRPPGPPPLSLPASPPAREEKDETGSSAQFPPPPPMELDEIPLLEELPLPPMDDLPPPPVSLFDGDDDVFPPPPPPNAEGLSLNVAMDVDELPPPFEEMSESSTPLKDDLQNSFEMEMDQLVSLLDSVAAEADSALKKPMLDKMAKPASPMPARPSKPPAVAKKPKPTPSPLKPRPPVALKSTRPAPPSIKHTTGTPSSSPPSSPPVKPIPFNMSPLARRRAESTPSPMVKRRLAPPAVPIPYADSPAAKRKLTVGGDSPKPEPLYAKVIRRPRATTLPDADTSSEKKESPCFANFSPLPLPKKLILSDGTKTVRGAKGRVESVVRSFDSDGDSASNSPLFVRQPKEKEEKPAVERIGKPAVIVFTIPPPPAGTPPQSPAPGVKPASVSSPESPPGPASIEKTSPLLLDEKSNEAPTEQEALPPPPPVLFDDNEEEKPASQEKSFLFPVADEMPSPRADIMSGSLAEELPPPPPEMDDLGVPPLDFSLSKQSSASSLPPPPPPPPPEEFTPEGVNVAEEPLPVPLPDGVGIDVAVAEEKMKMRNENHESEIVKDEGKPCESGDACTSGEGCAGLQSGVDLSGVEENKGREKDAMEGESRGTIEDEPADEQTEMAPSSVPVSLDASSVESKTSEGSKTEETPSNSRHPDPAISLNDSENLMSVPVDDKEVEIEEKASVAQPETISSDSTLLPNDNQMPTTDDDKNKAEENETPPTETTPSDASPQIPVADKSEPELKEKSEVTELEPPGASLSDTPVISVADKEEAEVNEKTSEVSANKAEPMPSGDPASGIVPAAEPDNEADSGPPSLPSVGPPEDDCESDEEMILSSSDGKHSKKASPQQNPMPVEMNRQSTLIKSHSEEDLLSGGHDSMRRTSMSASILGFPLRKKGTKLRWKSELDLPILYGEYSGTYSEVLTDIRGGNQQANLKKIPDAQPRRKSTGHTGMAAALFDALDVRRKKMLERRKSGAFDENEEDGGEWE